MGNSKIIDIYQMASDKEEKQFKENLQTKLHVLTDYEKVIKDTEWIEIIEQTIPYIDNIFRNPNRFIINEEEVVKIERARRITVESIKNLSKNTNFIQEVDKKTGDVKPSKILNIDKEESYDTYENRLIYTLIQNMKYFISQKKKKIEEINSANSKNDKFFDYTGISRIGKEKLEVNLSLTSKYEDENVKSENQNPDSLLERINQLEVKISDLTTSDVYKVVDKKHITLVREPIKKTNVVLKNVNFQYAMKLWSYLRENMEDKTRMMNEKKDYEADGELKDLMDDSFYLNYLIMSTIDKEKQKEFENEEKKKEIQNIVISKVLEKVVEMNDEMSLRDLKSIVGEKYLVIKNKNQASLQEIQGIFSNHIEKYLEQVKK